MKKAVFTAGLFFAAVFSQAQDLGEVVRFLEAHGISQPHHGAHYNGAWLELLFNDAPLEMYYALLGLGVAVEPEPLFQGQSPLVSAINRRNEDAVRFFLRHGADPHREQDNGRLPIHAAAVDGSARMIEILLEAGASPHATARWRRSMPLHEVVRNRSSLGMDDHAERIRVLLAAGADANATTEDGWTPLMTAAGNPLITQEEIRVLLAAGANVKAVSDNGMNALLAAAGSARSPGVIRLLLEAGADTGLRDSVGRTALERLDMNQSLNRHPVRGELWERSR